MGGLLSDPGRYWARPGCRLAGYLTADRRQPVGWYAKTYLQDQQDFCSFFIKLT
jgi:hypothetical protein